MIKKNFTIDYILAPKRDIASATTVSTNNNNNTINNNNSNDATNVNINNNNLINSGDTVVQLNVVVKPFDLDGDVDSGEYDGEGDGEGDSECNNSSSRLSQYSASPSSVSASSSRGQSKNFDKEEKEKGPFCAKCKLHSEYFLVKNHKDQCKRRFCDCEVCSLIDKGKTLRGKKGKKDSSSTSKSNRSNRRVTDEDVIALASRLENNLKVFISQETGPKRMEKLLNSVLHLLLQQNRYDASTLKKKISEVARDIAARRQGRNCNIMGGINSFHGESSEVVGPSNPLLLTERSNLDRPRHLSSSSATTFSPQSYSCLSSSPNTIIIPTNLPTPLLSSSIVGPSPSSLMVGSSPSSSTLTSPPSGLSATSLAGNCLNFAPTPLTCKTINSAAATNTSSSSSISSTSSTSSSTPSATSASIAAAAACSSLLSLTGTEYSVSSVTAIPQPTIFSSSLFCPTYPYSPLATSGPLQSPYQTTINCPTGIIRSPPFSISPGKSPFSSSHHHPSSTRSSPNSCASFARTNNSVSIHLAESIHKSPNNHHHHHHHHHNHQHATSLYSFLGSNSGAINLSKR